MENKSLFDSKIYKPVLRGLQLGNKYPFHPWSRKPVSENSQLSDSTGSSDTSPDEPPTTGFQLGHTSTLPDFSFPKNTKENLLLPSTHSTRISSFATSADVPPSSDCLLTSPEFPTLKPSLFRSIVFKSATVPSAKSGVAFLQKNNTFATPSVRPAEAVVESLPSGHELASVKPAAPSRYAAYSKALSETATKNTLVSHLNSSHQHSVKEKESLDTFKSDVKSILASKKYLTEGLRKSSAVQSHMPAGKTLNHPSQNPAAESWRLSSKEFRTNSEHRFERNSEKKNNGPPSLKLSSQGSGSSLSTRVEVVDPSYFELHQNDEFEERRDPTSVPELTLRDFITLPATKKKTRKNNRPELTEAKSELEQFNKERDESAGKISELCVIESDVQSTVYAASSDKKEASIKKPARVKRVKIHLTVTPCWYFLDSKETWTAYGENDSSNTSQTRVMSISSKDIEEHFRKSPETPLVIKSNSFVYSLNLQKMIQTNLTTGTERPMWRKVEMQSTFFEWNYVSGDGRWLRFEQVPLKDNTFKCLSREMEQLYAENPKGKFVVHIGKQKMAIDFDEMTRTQMQTKVVSPIRRALVIPSASASKNRGPPPRGATINCATEFQWRYRNERGLWIKYGLSSDLDDKRVDSSTNNSSDVEDFFCGFPQPQSMKISSQFQRYLIDFREMTQTNLVSKVKRSVRCTKNYAFVNYTNENGLFMEEESLPEYWSPMLKTASVAFVSMNMFCDDFGPVEFLIHQTLPTNRIIRMERIQNPFLVKTYRNKKEHAERQRRAKIREELLCHGTSENNIVPIIEQNLDWRLYGTSSARSTFGQGAYFSNKASLSLNYCPKDATKPTWLLVFRVLVGDCTVGNSNLTRPPLNPASGHLFDTAVNRKENPSIFVKFDSQEYYPEYLVVLQPEDSSKSTGGRDASSQRPPHFSLMNPIRKTIYRSAD